MKPINKKLRNTRKQLKKLRGSYKEEILKLPEKERRKLLEGSWNI